MQIQRVQNNRYNTSFCGSVTLVKRVYDPYVGIIPQNTITKIGQKQIDVKSDKTLHELFKKLLGKEDKRPDFTEISTLNAKKEDFIKFVDHLKQTLGLENEIPIFNEPNKSLMYCYSKHKNGEIKYWLNLSNDDPMFEDALIITHEMPAKTSKG